MNSHTDQLSKLSSSTAPSSVFIIKSSDCDNNVTNLAIHNTAPINVTKEPSINADLALIELTKNLLNESANNNESTDYVDILNPINYPLWNGTATEPIKTNYCTSSWDGLYCWPSTPSGYRAFRACKDIFISAMDSDHIAHTTNSTNAYAYRICDNKGIWHNNWTNYTECLQILVESDDKSDNRQQQLIRQIVVLITFFCSTVSLILLLISLFIFCYFKSLKSSRIRVHQNLVVALIIHSTLLIVLAWPHLADIFISRFENSKQISQLTNNATTSSMTSSVKRVPSDWIVIDWLCKLILAMQLYSTLASINWMFIEGLLLYSRLTVSILRKDAPFKLYHMIGWGLPLILICIWTTQMSLTLSTHCWSGYADSISIWIIIGPMSVALLFNCIFLVNVIRILLTKLRLTVTAEMDQIQKAFKATVLLFPMLGISHLLFFINPNDNGQLEDAYMIANSLLQSSQGIFVSILYCFMDSDVKQVLRNSLQRNTRQGNKFTFTLWRDTSASVPVGIVLSTANSSDTQSIRSCSSEIVQNKSHYLNLPETYLSQSVSMNLHSLSTGTKNKNKTTLKLSHSSASLQERTTKYKRNYSAQRAHKQSTRKARNCIVYDCTSGQMILFNQTSPN